MPFVVQSIRMATPIESVTRFCLGWQSRCPGRATYYAVGLQGRRKQSRPMCRGCALRRSRLANVPMPDELPQL